MKYRVMMNDSHLNCNLHLDVESNNGFQVLQEAHEVWVKLYGQTKPVIVSVKELPEKNQVR